MRKDKGRFRCLAGWRKCRGCVVEVALRYASVSPSWENIQKPLIASTLKSHSNKLDISLFSVTLSHSDVGLQIQLLKILGGLLASFIYLFHKHLLRISYILVLYHPLWIMLSTYTTSSAHCVQTCTHHSIWVIGWCATAWAFTSDDQGSETQVAYLIVYKYFPNSIFFTFKVIQRKLISSSYLILF